MGCKLAGLEAGTWTGGLEMACGEEGEKLAGEKAGIDCRTYISMMMWRSVKPRMGLLS